MKKSILVLTLTLFVQLTAYSYRTIVKLKDLIFKSTLIIEGKFVQQINESKYLFVCHSTIVGTTFNDTIVIAANISSCGMFSYLEYDLEKPNTLLFLTGNPQIPSKNGLTPNTDGVIYNYNFHRGQVPVNNFTRAEMIQAIKVLHYCFVADGKVLGNSVSTKCDREIIMKAKTYSALLKNLIEYFEPEDLSFSKEQPTPTLKSILLEQLKNTHTNKDWYVPTKLAIEGLTADQVNVKDSTGNHSIGELVSHLIFWNERILIAFHGDTPPNFNDDNEITFKKFDSKNWTASVQKLDSIQTKWEHEVENATELQLNKWSSSIANICSHNAYHTGQIIYIRKQHGWWKPANGVK